MIEPLVAFSSIRQNPHPLARHSLTADLTNWPAAPSQENLLSKFFFQEHTLDYGCLALKMCWIGDWG